MSDHDYELLGASDGYDADEVFDDVAPAKVSRPASREAQKRAVRQIIKQAQRSRLSPPALTVEPASRDEVLGEIARSEYDILGEILGTDSAPGAAFSPLTSPDLPITQKLYNKFQAGLPAPKIVRVDTEDSYAKFRDGLRAPYLAQLEDRISALEANVADHESDNHGGGRVARLEDALERHIAEARHNPEVLGADVEQAAEQARAGGTKIPLSLHPADAGKVDSWQDGDVIYCSVRLPGIRIATTSTPVERHVEEVMQYAADADVDPVEVMGVLPVVAQILGGGALVTQLCCAAPELLARPEVVAGQVFVGKVAPKSSPDVAAVMALLQLCQRGDKRACAEQAKIEAGPGGKKLVARAKHALTKALAAKSKGRP